MAIFNGTEDDDFFLGTLLDDIFFGNGGNDEIYGGGGNDIANGGAGDDYIETGDGNDTIDGGADNDTVFGGAGNDSILGGLGDDSLFGGDGNDFINGEEGDDFINGASGDDVLLGGAGADTIVGGGGSDFLSGGADDDVINSHNGIQSGNLFEREEMYGGAGADTFNLFTNYTGGRQARTPSARPGATTGDQSFAIINDFSAADGDALNLRDRISSYQFIRGNFRDRTSRSISDTFILSQNGNNLVAVVVDATITTAGQVSA
jgi:Ca2+-binding RTX toxin-like protein